MASKKGNSPKVGKAGRKKSLGPEAEMQIDFINWYKRTYPNREIMHISNHATTVAQRKIFVAMGMTPGASDVWIDEPSSGYRALYMELKSEMNYKKKGQGLRQNQIDFLKHKARKGNLCFVSWNLFSCKAIVMNYYKGSLENLNNNNFKLKQVT